MTAYIFFLAVSLASMQIKKSLHQGEEKTPDLSLKYIPIQVHDQQGQQEE